MRDNRTGRGRARSPDFVRRVPQAVRATPSGKPPTARRRRRWFGLIIRICCCWISRMPVLNGLEVLEQLRDAREAMMMKVAMLSHQRDADARLESFALGVVAYWTRGSLAERAQLENPGAAGFHFHLTASWSTTVATRFIKDTRPRPWRSRSRLHLIRHARRLSGQPRLPVRPAELRAARHAQDLDGAAARPDAAAAPPAGRPARGAPDRPCRGDQGQRVDRGDDRRRADGLGRADGPVLLAAPAPARGAVPHRRPRTRRRPSWSP